MDSQDVRFYVSIFLRRLHYFLLPVVVVTVVGSLAALWLPPIYLAVAKILVESPRISADLVRPSVSTDTVQQLQVLEQQLTTRESLVGMARRFAIYPATVRMSPDDVVSDMLARTKVEPVELNNLGSSNSAIAFAISFEASDPVLASDVANAYATAILDTNARQRMAQADDALEFFRQEVGRLEAALDKAQGALLQFKREHADSLPDSLEFRRMQQSNYEERLRQLQRDEASLRLRRSTIEQILATPANGRAPTTGDQSLVDLRRLLADQEAIFSEDSPNLQMLRSRIAALEKRLAEEQSGQKDVSQRTDLSPELRVQFADIQGQLDFIVQERENIKRTLADLARSISETEMNSTMLSGLERDVETAQSQHNEAVSRLAQSSTGQRIEAEAIGGKLTLLESAEPPTKPVWPKRRAIALGSLVAGIGLGLGLVIVLEFWSSTIRRPADLASAFDGQPFATIPYISSGREAFARRMAAAGLVVALLGSIPGLLMVREHLPAPITAALSSISNGIRIGPSR